MEWSSGIAAAVAAGVTPYVLRSLTRGSSSNLRDGDAYILRYRRGWSVFLATTGALLLVGFTALLLFGDLDRNGRITVLPLDLAFGALVAFGAVEVAKVAHRVDEAGFERRTPWRPWCKVPWSAITHVRYEPQARIFMRSQSGEKLRVSLYLTSLGPLASFLLTRVAEGAIDPTTRRELERLARALGAPKTPAR